MERSFQKILQGYQLFRKKYIEGDQSIMQSLSLYGQKPEIMVTACCDSRVDPALILQCDPGDLFVVRNVANIIPPFEDDEAHRHGGHSGEPAGSQIVAAPRRRPRDNLGRSAPGGAHPRHSAGSRRLRDQPRRFAHDHLQP